MKETAEFVARKPSPETVLAIQAEIKKMVELLAANQQKLREVLVEKLIDIEEIEWAKEDQGFFAAFFQKIAVLIKHGGFSTKEEEQQIANVVERLSHLREVISQLERGKFTLASTVIAEQIAKKIPGHSAGWLVGESAEDRRLVREQLFGQLAEAYRLQLLLSEIDPQAAADLTLEIRTSARRIQDRLGNPLGNTIPEELSAFIE
ncbi:MAG: hypothetical protein COY81_00990 [Candidatus Pacebacteria bacterium CG_4_10_14_0_8_um_filter_43_12]|nr:MAG: hypothetical protein COU66_03940 [Candidatus Pacebacteria bacterium CG10_big_fil_rev_8_21_14_0_10_44_11]PIY79722.1 MAG: hypothetical protein COY81_00990 [Candidatus Pacebacteria bacterium CG_4_10_14_0_8_um_filter_43_12]